MNGVIVSVFSFERQQHVTLSFEKLSLKRLSEVGLGLGF
jgi:hypothetical protein